MKTTRTRILIAACILAVSLTASAGTLKYTYDGAGRLTGVDYGNSTNTTYTYDNNGNLVQEVTAESIAADLTMSKSAIAGPVPAGTPLTYSLLVTNSGPDAASDVVVLDTLPFGVSLMSAVASQGSCSSLGQDMTCNLGLMAAGSTAAIEITVRPAFSGVFSNEASVALAQVDAILGDNSDDAVTTVIAAVDTDGDGLPDWWELMHSGNITNVDKAADSDEDDVTNGEEYDGDTDPNDPNSYLRIVDILNLPPIKVEWETSPIRVYKVQATSNLLNSASWTDLNTGIEGSGLKESASDTNAPIPARAYRIQATAP